MTPVFYVVLLLQEEKKSREDDDHYCPVVHRVLGTISHSPHVV